MVRLVVLVAVLTGFLSACSSIPSATKHDPRTTESQELEFEYAPNELEYLNEGKHHPAVQVLLTQAEDERKFGTMSQALAYLDQARQIQPRNSAILYRQAWLNLELGRLRAAQQLLQRAKLYMSSDESLQRRVMALQEKIDAKRGY